MLYYLNAVTPAILMSMGENVCDSLMSVSYLTYNLGLFSTASFIAGLLEDHDAIRTFKESFLML